MYVRCLFREDFSLFFCTAITHWAFIFSQLHTLPSQLSVHLCIGQHRCFLSPVLEQRHVKNCKCQTEKRSLSFLSAGNVPQVWSAFRQWPFITAGRQRFRPPPQQDQNVFVWGRRAPAYCQHCKYSPLVLLPVTCFSLACPPTLLLNIITACAAEKRLREQSWKLPATKNEHIFCHYDSPPASSSTCLRSSPEESSLYLSF